MFSSKNFEEFLLKPISLQYKKMEVEKISRLFDSFKIRFRFAYELGLINDKKFDIAQKQIEEIGKMIGGWQKWVETSKPTSHPYGPGF